MKGLFGETRTRVAARHALIAPDGHVASHLESFQKATPYFLISPAIGARFSQLFIRFEAGGYASFPADALETALYVQSGDVEFKVGDFSAKLSSGDFAFAPAGTKLELESTGGAEITCFRKIYEPLAGTQAPGPLVGHSADVEGKPFLGNPHARLKTLLPETPDFDLAINLFTYDPGATLPFVETHIMEHGLLMIEGQGVYRLEESYYPVCAGDVIWMAPYCPQWFVAMGDTPATYLYYKNVNRHG